MSRNLWLGLGVIVLLTGCGQPKWSMEAPQKPTPPEELNQLARFVGTWTGTAELVEPTPAMTPDDAEEMPTAFNGGGKLEWTLDGMALRGEGWYEMGPDQKVHYVEYWSWDEKNDRFRLWSISDWGDTGLGWAEFEPDGDTMYTEATMIDAAGNTKHGKGSLTFVGNDEYTWTYTEKGPMGVMRLKGNSTRTD